MPALEQSTQFRVFTTTNTPVISAVATENVAVRVISHVARTRRRGFARIYGTVTPAVIGAQVGMLRIAQGHGILAGGTVVKPLNSISGQFSRVVRVQKGAYRVLVQGRARRRRLGLWHAAADPLSCASAAARRRRRSPTIDRSIDENPSGHGRVA